MDIVVKLIATQRETERSKKGKKKGTKKNKMRATDIRHITKNDKEENHQTKATET